MRRWSTSFFYVLLPKSYRRKSLSPSTFRPWLLRLTSIGGCFPNGFSTAKLSGRSLFPFFGAYGGVGTPLLFDHAGPNVCSTVMKIVGFFWEIGPWFPSPHRRSVNFNDFGLSYTVGFLMEPARKAFMVVGLPFWCRQDSNTISIGVQALDPVVERS